MSSIGLVGWWVGCAASGFASAALAIDAAGAGTGAVEAVRNAVVLPTSGTEAWWRVAVREAVYAMREVQYVREAVDWTVLLKKLGGLQLLQRLDPLSNLKPSLLQVSRHLLNCLWSIGAVLFT